MLGTALIFCILALSSTIASTQNDTFLLDEVNNGTTGINITDLRNDIRLSTKGNLELQKIQAEMWKILLRMLGRITQSVPPPVAAPPDWSANKHIQERLEAMESKLENLTRDQMKLKREFDDAMLQRLSIDCAGYDFVRIGKLRSLEDIVPSRPGMNSSKLFICRAKVDGATVPGAGVITSVGGDGSINGICSISYEGKEHKLERGFQVLVNPQNNAQLQWVAKSSCAGDVTKNALPAGRSMDSEIFYVGRCKADTHGVIVDVIGRVADSAPEMTWYALDGDEFKCSDYHILTCG